MTPERQADVSRSEEPMDIDALHSAAVDHTRTIVRDLGTELASQVTRAGRLQAAITQARAELLANQPWNERIDAALEVLDGALVLPTVDTAPVEEAWRPIETYGSDELNPNPIVLRPHRIHGPMDVRRLTYDERAKLTGALSQDADWRWANGDMTTAWTETAFEPFWMPLPPMPGTPRLDPATCRAQGHGRVACERCGAEWVDVASVRERTKR